MRIRPFAVTFSLALSLRDGLLLERLRQSPKYSRRPHRTVLFDRVRKRHVIIAELQLFFASVPAVVVIEGFEARDPKIDGKKVTLDWEAALYHTHGAVGLIELWVSDVSTGFPFPRLVDYLRYP